MVCHAGLAEVLYTNNGFCIFSHCGDIHYRALFLKYDLDVCVGERCVPVCLKG